MGEGVAPEDTPRAKSGMLTSRVGDYCMSGTDHPAVVLGDCGGAQGTFQKCPARQLAASIMSCSDGLPESLLLVWLGFVFPSGCKVLLV